MKQYTIYEIAKLANVSPSTVSRVAADRPNVSEKTRARVQRIINECHYMPNETARSLVTQSSRMIGILISDIRLTHHAYGVYFMERELMKDGYCCLIFNTGVEEQEHIQYIQMLSQRKVEAAILIGSIYQTESVKNAIETYLPHTPVMINNGCLDLPNVYGVISDEQNGVSDCVHLLADKGKKHIAFVMDRETPSNLLKQQGFEAAVAKDTAPLVIKTDGTRQGAYSATRKMLEEHPETDGIVYSDDVLATVGVHALRDLKRKIPEEVAVIGINNSFYAELSTPQLTSLDNMLYDQSLTVVRTLLDLLTGNHVNRQVMIYSEIVERETT